jgi:hypothetical protein
MGDNPEGGEAVPVLELNHPVVQGSEQELQQLQVQLQQLQQERDRAAAALAETQRA